MALLDRLLKAPKPRFLYHKSWQPTYDYITGLTTKPYRRKWSVQLPQRRDTLAITNASLYSSSKRSLPQRFALPVASFIDISGADRRLYNPHPSPNAVDIYGNQVVPTDVSEPGRWAPWHSPLERRFLRPVMPTPRGIGERKINWNPNFWKNLQNAPWWYGFANADKVVICLKRKIRREVMAALGKIGIKGQKQPTYNTFSRVRC